MSETTPQPYMTDQAQRIVDGLYDRAAQLPDARTEHFGSRSELGHRIEVPLDEGRKLNIQHGSQTAFGGDITYTKMSITGGDPGEEHPFVRVGNNEHAGKYVSSQTIAFKGRHGTERVVTATKPSESLRAIHAAVVAKEKEAQK